MVCGSQYQKEQHAKKILLKTLLCCREMNTNEEWLLLFCSSLQGKVSEDSPIAQYSKWARGWNPGDGSSFMFLSNKCSYFLRISVVDLFCFDQTLKLKQVYCKRVKKRWTIAWTDDTYTYKLYVLILYPPFENCQFYVSTVIVSSLLHRRMDVICIQMPDGSCKLSYTHTHKVIYSQRLFDVSFEEMVLKNMTSGRKIQFFLSFSAFFCLF